MGPYGPIGLERVKNNKDTSENHCQVDYIELPARNSGNVFSLPIYALQFHAERLNLFFYCYITRKWSNL